jgi:autoinducer 2-degrading protein
MHIVVEFVEAHPGHVVALRGALQFLARMTIEKKRGCRQFDVGQDSIDGSTFLIYQIYETREAYTEHLELPEYADHRILSDPWIKTRRILTYDLVSHGGSA